MATQSQPIHPSLRPPKKLKQR